MSKARSVLEVLVATRWILQNVGWVQGQYHKYVDGEIIGVCLMSALRLVDTQHVNHQIQARGLLYQDIEAEAVDIDETFALGSWNDQKGRKKEDVIALLTQIINGLTDEADEGKRLAVLRELLEVRVSLGRKRDRKTNISKRAKSQD